MVKAVGLVRDGGVPELLIRRSRDVVLRYTVRVEEIHLRGTTMGLEEQIAQLDAEIARAAPVVAAMTNLPAEVQAVLAEHNRMLPDVTELQSQRKQLRDLLDRLEAVTDWESPITIGKI